MMRQFKFEDEIHRTLSCVPMAVRRKLDKVGVKISLDQWQALGRGERLAICHLPARTVDECDAMRVFIEEAVANRGAGATKPLPEAMRTAADPPDSPPTKLLENARSLGVTFGQAEWDRLNADERYALIKLGAGNDRSHNLRAALREFLTG
jgi:hypothetical protein